MQFDKKLQSRPQLYTQNLKSCGFFKTVPVQVWSQVSCFNLSIFKMSPSFFQKRKSAGFSLIEVLASVLLLAGVISIIVQISYGNTRRIRKARQLEKAAHLLEKKMLEIEEKFRMDQEISTEEEGEFEEEEHYFWSYETRPFVLPSPEMLLSLANIPETEMNIKMFEIMKSVLSENTFELKLTVRYEGKKRQGFTYSLVSYFIDYQGTQHLIFENLMGLFPGNSAQ